MNNFICFEVYVGSVVKFVKFLMIEKMFLIVIVLSD